MVLCRRSKLRLVIFPRDRVARRNLTKASLCGYSPRARTNHRERSLLWHMGKNAEMSSCPVPAETVRATRARYLIAFAAATFAIASCGNTTIDANSPPTSSTPTPLTGGTHTTMDAVTATLPPVLAQSSICSQGSKTEAGDLYLFCTVSSASPLSRGLSDDGIVYLVWVNTIEAERILQDWRGGDQPELITENIARTAAARLEYRDAVNSVHYVNTVDGLNIDISAGSLPTAEAAITFLRRADLMN